MTNPEIVQPKSRHPLHKAIIDGDLERANELLARGADLFEINANRKTPLDFVAEYGTPEIKKFFRDYINQTDSDNKTLLHYAALNGDADQVKQLLKCGANMQAEDKDHFTPLEYAMELATLLPRYDAVVSTLINSKDEYGITPLHYAALKGKKDAVDLMIEHGANLNAKDKNGNQPHHYAAEGLRMRTELVREKMQEQKLDPAKGIPAVLKEALMKDHMDILNVLKKPKVATENKKTTHGPGFFDDLMRNPRTETPASTPKKDMPKKHGR